MLLVQRDQASQLSGDLQVGCQIGDHESVDIPSDEIA